MQVRLLRFFLLSPFLAIFLDDELFALTFAAMDDVLVLRPFVYRRLCVFMSSTSSIFAKLYFKITYVQETLTP